MSSLKRMYPCNWFQALSVLHLNLFWRCNLSNAHFYFSSLCPNWIELLLVWSPNVLSWWVSFYLIMTLMNSSLSGWCIARGRCKTSPAIVDIAKVSFMRSCTFIMFKWFLPLQTSNIWLAPGFLPIFWLLWWVCHTWTSFRGYLPLNYPFIPVQHDSIMLNCALSSIWVTLLALV